jgi:curved DNA-binding protein CbpA
MKRITEYKKLFDIQDNIDLKELKKSYRNLVKEWHPDKFQDEEKRAEADVISKKVIDGYHFLVSIAPETKDANKDEYALTCSTSGIADYKHKSMLMEISFTDGTTYEYFGVNKGLFQKFINSDKQYRFAKRNILNSFPFRKSKKDVVL